MKKVLYLVILTSVLFLWYYHGNPFIGYLAFSEAFYSAEARNYAIGNILVPQVEGGVDYNVPPLYSMLNYIAFGAVQQPGNARALNIFFHVLNVLLVCRIAQKTSGDVRAGIVAGILYASLPITSELALTMIPETVWMTLLLTGYLFYLHERYLISFSVLSLAMFAKQPTIILGLILFMYHYKKRRSVLLSVALFCLMTAILSGFYLLHLSWYGTQFLSDVQERAGVARLPGFVQLCAMASEVFFAGSFTAIMIGKAAINRKKRNMDWYIFISYATFFLFYHHHSYYVFPALVFGVILFANGIDYKKSNYRTLVAFLFVCNVLFTLRLIPAARPAHDPFDAIMCQNVTASDDFVEYWWPVWRYHCPENDVLTCGEAPESANADRPCIGFWDCDAKWSNPNWFRPADGRCDLYVKECECPIEDHAPTFRWSDYV
jgi:4-amino-4-deoxy-L-arabinose transferase-like glycosyltransferase